MAQLFLRIGFRKIFFYNQFEISFQNNFKINKKMTSKNNYKKEVNCVIKIKDYKNLVKKRISKI